ncbi:hypothetical protein RHECNPAF_1780019 [Rhizobium etli CNPAF512]|nr:hypothetical protein RHECNPAF_1780019 [Rhizobium etli CNPAF512]
MSKEPLPENLHSLHCQEEQLRGKALELVRQDQNLRLHVTVVEQAMNIGDLLRHYPTNDEDMKVIQMLGMRMFNAFGASLKLALSGYIQNSTLLMRDVLETVFLVDLFRGERDLIEKWRFADSKTLKADFSPAAVRKALDSRYGHTSRRREETYKLFCELAGHPTMKSAWMMRPQKDGDAVVGPFIEKTSLEAVLSEMGRLAVQAGLHLIAFFPSDWQQGVVPRHDFTEAAREWIATFYPEAASA